MKYEKFVREYNEINKLKRKNENMILSKFSELQEIKNVIFTPKEIGKDLNYIGKLLLQNLEVEKKFKFDKTWVGSGDSYGRLVIEYGGVCFRKYQCSNKIEIDFLSEHGYAGVVIPLLDDKFRKMLIAVNKKIEEYEKEKDNTFFEERDNSYGTYSGRNKKEILLNEKDIDIDIYQKEKWGSDDGFMKITIKKVKSIIKIIDARDSRVEYKIELYDSQDDGIEADGLLYYTNDDILKLYDRMFKLFHKNSNKLIKKVKGQHTKIYNIMEKFGFKEILALRGI